MCIARGLARQHAVDACVDKEQDSSLACHAML